MRRPALPASSGNLLQVAVTILVAAVLALAALSSSKATGAWHDALREDIKWSAATVEDARVIYTAEGPMALDIAIAETRARALRTTGADLATWDAGGEEQAAGHLRLAQRGTGNVVDGDRYRLESGAYDLPRRLADLRGTNPGLRDLNPDGTMRRGDAAQSRANGWVFILIPLILIILVGRPLLRRWSRPSRLRRDVGLIPGSDDTSGTARMLAVLMVAGWVAVTALPVAQIISGNQEQRALTLSARQAQHLTATISVSGFLLGYQGESARRINGIDLRTDTREFAATDLENPALAGEIDLWLAADRAALAGAREVAATMAAAPGPESGVDARTRTMLLATPAEWERLRLEQNRTADAAQSAGTRSDLLQMAILLAAMSLSLALLAATEPPRRDLVVRVSVGLLACAGVVALAVLGGG